MDNWWEVASSLRTKVNAHASRYGLEDLSDDIFQESFLSLLESPDQKINTVVSRVAKRLDRQRKKPGSYCPAVRAEKPLIVPTVKMQHAN